MPFTVKFGRPTYRTTTSKRTGGVIVFDDEPIYTSKCGRFRIEKHTMTGGGRSFNDCEYRVFRIADEERLGTYDHYRDARGACEFELNPNWEG